MFSPMRQLCSSQSVMVWLLLCLSLVLGAGPLGPYDALAAQAASSQLPSQVEAMLRNNKAANRRDNWLPLIRQIDEALAQGAAKDESALLLAKAKARSDMARRFATKPDDEAARAALDSLLAKYPKDAKAPQALWLRAQVAARQGREAEAGADLTRLLADYPASPYAAKVRAKASGDSSKISKTDGSKQSVSRTTTQVPASRTDSTAASRSSASPASSTPEKETRKKPAEPNARANSAGPQPKPDVTPLAKQADPKNKQANPNALELASLRATGGPDYSRVIAAFSKPVRFSAKMAEQPKGKPDAPSVLYIDFPDASLAQVSEAETTGILRSAKASSLGKKGVRLSLEVDNLSRYQVFPIEGGTRVVTDVFGCATPAPATRTDKRNDTLLGKSNAQGKAKGKVAAAKVSGVCDLAEQLGLTVKTVMIDAGHGGKDPGAKGVGGVYEKDVNLKLARLLGAELKKDGIEVIYSRDADVFIPLEGRPAAANARRADLFVSLHCNSHSDKTMSGVETYTFNLAKSKDAVRVASAENGVSARGLSDMQAVVTELLLSSKRDESRDLAKAVHANMLKPSPVKGHRDKGPAEAPFYVLMGTKMPAILVEVGYLTNPDEGAKLGRQDHLERLAKALAGGIMSYKGKLEHHMAKAR